MSANPDVTSQPENHILFLDDRVDKTENIQARELGVYFSDLRVTGLGASVSYQPTVGSLLDPRAQLDALHALRHPAVRTLLDGFDGVVRPGETIGQVVTARDAYNAVAPHGGRIIEWLVEDEDPVSPGQPIQAPWFARMTGSSAETRPPGERRHVVVPSASTTRSTGSRLATTTRSAVEDLRVRGLTSRP